MLLCKGSKEALNCCLLQLLRGSRRLLIQGLQCAVLVLNIIFYRAEAFDKSFNAKMQMVLFVCHKKVTFSRTHSASSLKVSYILVQIGESGEGWVTHDIS